MVFKHGRLAAALILLGLLAGCGTTGNSAVRKGEPAPAFTLEDLNGNQVSLSDLKGKPVMVTFWASWCESCKEEIPLIEKFSQGKRDQITLLLVAIDGENEKRIQRIIKDKKISLPDC